MKKNYVKVVEILFLFTFIVCNESDEDILVEYNCAAEYREDNLYEQGKDFIFCVHFIPHLMKTMYKL